MQYPDRFDSNLNWQKILFKPDVKTQAAELNEIQSLINYQGTQAFSYLLDIYQIVKGLKISFNSFTSTGYIMKVDAGQVFIRLENKGYFIDIKESTFEVPFNQRIYLGMLPIFSYIQDELPDPTTGNLFGKDLGSDRLVVSSELILSQDSYPIAVIEGRGIGQFPYIFYFTEDGYSLQYSENYVSSLITDYIALRVYEEAGNFIAEGLDLNISSTNSITISSGFAYINGRKIDLCYPFPYEFETIQSEVYSFYLTSFGGVIVENKPPTDKPNSILLGLVQFQNGKYHTIPSKARPLVNSDVKLLQERNKLNQQTLLNFSLERQLINNHNTENISGTLVDTFVNLSNSDINSFLFSAAILPKYGILKPNTFANNISFTNLTEVTNKNTETFIKNSVPTYITPRLSEKIIINQDRATSFFAITDTIAKPTIRVSPPNGQINVTSKEFQSISNVDIPNSYNLEIQPVINNLNTSTLQASTLTLEGFGFRANEDNLKILFDSIPISIFNIIKGTQGTNNLTFKAFEDGSFIITFSIPIGLPFKDYTISVSNSTSTATFLYCAKPSNIKLDYKPILGQSFTIEKNIIVDKINLAIKRVPTFNSNSIDLALITLVKTNNGLPTTEIVGQGVLKLSSVITSNNGSDFSSVSLDEPVILNKGQYAFIISILAPGQPLELFCAEIGKRSLSSTSISNIQPLLGGEMLINVQNQWIKNMSKDLTFQLIQVVPMTNVSEISYKIENPLDQIHYINRNIKACIPTNTKVEYFIKNNNNSWILFNESQAVQGNKNEVEFKIVLHSKEELFPIILPSQSCLTLHKNSLESTWISKTITYFKEYKNVEIEFDYYKPTGTDIVVLFSSNGGETWEPIELDFNKIKLVNGNIPLYQGTYIVKDLEPTTISTDINGASSKILRTRFTIRINFISKSSEMIPYIRKLKSIVY